MPKESNRAVIIDPETGQYVKVTSDGKLQVDTEIAISGDITIGDVRLKDATTDTLAKVYLGGAVRVSGDRLPSGNGDYGSVTVTATPSIIIGGRADLKRAIFTPFGTVYFGLDASVSSSNGFIMYSGDVYDDQGSGIYTGNIYGVTSSGSVLVPWQRRW